jgi:serine/threonine protein kinase
VFGQATVSRLPTTLRQLIERVGPLDYKRAATYVAEIAQQLAALHRSGELHRDVRPANIVLDEAGAAHLAAVEIIAVQYEAQAIESADYLAPDALNSYRAGPPVDIYSLGCVFYYLLTGQPPFPSGSISERLLKHQVGTPTAIVQLRPDAPQPLVRICEKMMAKKPADRYQSADEVAEAVAEWRRLNR